MNQKNVRVQRTQKALREALMSLATENGYELVKVRDIAKRAGVGYKTFYRHYSDKDNLLYSILEGVLQEAQAVLLPPTSPQAPEQNTLNALRFAHQYAGLFRVLLRSPMAERLVRPFIAFGFAEGLRSFGGSDIPDELVAHHFVTSMMSLIRWWLEQATPCSPEVMADYMNRLLIRPLIQRA